MLCKTKVKNKNGKHKFSTRAGLLDDHIFKVEFHDTDLVDLNGIDSEGNGEISSVNNIFKDNSETEDITVGIFKVEFHGTDLVDLNGIDSEGNGEISSVNNIFKDNSETEDITVDDLGAYIVENKVLLDSQVVLKMKMIYVMPEL